MVNGHNNEQASSNESLDTKEFINRSSKLLEIKHCKLNNYHEQLCHILSELLASELVLFAYFSNNSDSYKLFGNTQKPADKIIPKDLVHIVFHDNDYKEGVMIPFYHILLRHLDKIPINGYYYYYTLHTVNQTIKALALSLPEYKAKFIKNGRFNC